MYCTKCGAELKEGAKFCTKCGKPVNNTGAMTDRNPSSQSSGVSWSFDNSHLGTEATKINANSKKKSRGRNIKAILLATVIVLATVAIISIVFLAMRENGIIDFGDDSKLEDNLQQNDNSEGIKNSDRESNPDDESNTESLDAPDIDGEWVDTNGESSYITATELDDGEYQLAMYSSDNTGMSFMWNMNANWDSSAQRYVYDSCSKASKQQSSSSTYSETIYTDGTGSFYIIDKKMYWVDDKEDAGEKWVLQNYKDLDDDLFNSIRDNAMAEPVVATLLGYAPNMNANYTRANIAAATASSNITQKGYDNTATVLFDGNDDTSWQEGAAGYGIGETIYITLSKDYGIKYLVFKMGNWRDDHFYAGNCRPKTLSIFIGNSFQQQITFDDVKAEQWIELSREIKASQIRLVIDDVFVGGRWEDTCINEIGIYGN